ncbi:MAG: hypothetical protein FWD32_02830, partial [Firmicutes bacterium]|nr:hypothetical protein [Bacillota bacterium]
IEEARELGADFVIAVDVLGKPYQLKLNNVFKIIERAYLLVDAKCALEEVKKADIIITPDVGTKSIGDFKKCEEAIEIGRAAARAVIPQIKKLLGI